MQQTREETKKYSNQKIADNLSLGGYYTEFMKLCSPVTNVDYSKLISLPLKNKMNGDQESGLLVFIIGLLSLAFVILLILPAGFMSYNVNTQFGTNVVLKWIYAFFATLFNGIYYPLHYWMYGDVTRPSPYYLSNLSM